MWTHFDTGECPGPAVGVRMLLPDNGNATGFVALKWLSDTQPVTQPEDRVRLGMVVHARIRELQPERWRIELTCRTSDLRDLHEQWRVPRDQFYDRVAQLADEKRQADARRQAEHRATYTKRVIAHPQFRNVGYAQAAQMLRDAPVGDVLFRPSSKGPDHLTATWKVASSGCCLAHVDVLEDKKLNAFSIGRRLIVDGEDYEDLDEIVARYVAPQAALALEIAAHKNYRDLAQLRAAALAQVITESFSFLFFSPISFTFLCAHFFFEWSFRSRFEIEQTEKNRFQPEIDKTRQK